MPDVKTKTRNSRTENQIWIENAYLDNFYDFLETADPKYLATCEEIYRNKGSAYLVFDYNGTPDANVLWQKKMAKVPYILETNYLDGTRPWTRDTNGNEYDRTLSWQIITGEGLFNEIREKYIGLVDLFNDPVIKAAEYSNQNVIDDMELDDIIASDRVPDVNLR